MYRRQPPRRHACARCVQLKVKCVPAGATGVCQRCTRLGHPSCVFPTDVRGNRQSAGGVPQAQGAKQSPQSLQSNNRAPPVTASPPGNLTEPSATEQHGEDDSVFRGLISPQEVNDLLVKYRTQKMPQYPFVVIPWDVDASTLRQQSPFLLLCIVTACLEHVPSLQHALEAVVRTEIATRLVVNIERNMDLLQGLLVHIAWFHYHWRTYHTQMYMLLQMTIMVVGDLGLDKEEGFRMQVIPPEGKENNQSRGPASQTPAGQRALLGCYYLCSKSSIFRRQLIMRHTKWIDHCAKTLSQNPEYPSDLHIKTYSDLQLLAQRTRLLLDEELNQISGESRGDVWRKALKLMVHQLAKVNNLSSSNDTEIHWALRLELNAAPTLVLGQALQRRRDVFKLQEMNQLESLTASAHQILTTFLAVPSTIAVHLPAPTYATIWYGLLALSKLSVLFHADPIQAMGVDSKSIHESGIAIMKKLGELALEDDVWKNSQKIIGSMLLWLEKSNEETQSDRTPTIAITTQDSEIGRTTSQRTSFELRPQACGSGLSARIGDSSDQQAGCPPTHSAMEDFTSSHFGHQPTDEIEASLWQQMLESFTWFGPDADTLWTLGDYGNME